ncbi:MAG: hypothetical protein ACWIPH_05930 [Ostreibacterium sp.]
MKLNRCPICRSDIDLQALVQSEAGKELLGKMATLDTLTGNALLSYMSLFRPMRGSLSHDRALRLVTELEIIANGDWIRLAVAMQATVENMHIKAQQGQVIKPFKNHHYLEKVLEDVNPNISSQVLSKTTKSAALLNTKSKTRSALEQMENMKQ